MSAPYYQDEHVTLYHGDCLEVTEWLSADVLVTDPPYGVAWKGYDSTRRYGQTRALDVEIVGDDSPTVRDHVLDAWGTKPAIVFGNWRIPRPARTTNRLVWWKRGQGPGPTRAAFMSQDEEIYILGGGFVHTAPPQRSVIPTNEARHDAVKAVGHPTPKPVGLMELLIERCQPGWTIADPFVGGGATLIAARNLGRRAIGVELEERYCEIAAKRLAQGVLDLEVIA